MASMKDEIDKDAYTHVALVDGVGVDAYLERVVTELQRPDITASGIEGCLASLRDLILHVSLTPFIEKHRILPLVAQTLDVHARWPKEESLRATVYKEASFFIRWVSMVSSLPQYEAPDVRTAGGPKNTSQTCQLSTGRI